MWNYGDARPQVIENRADELSDDNGSSGGTEGGGGQNEDGYEYSSIPAAGSSTHADPSPGAPARSDLPHLGAAPQNELSMTPAERAQYAYYSRLTQDYDLRKDQEASTLVA